MGKKEKALAKILSGENDRNVNFSELRKAMELSGWTLDRVNGSHHIFVSPNGGSLSVPVHGDPIKVPYVRQARVHILNQA